MKKFLKDLAVYLVVAAALLLLFINAQPFLTRALPNDYSRHHVIVDALKNKAASPEIIILGDSRTMFGVDAKTISNNLPNKPLAYNLASVGQSYFESCYFISAVPASTRHIIQFIGYTAFREPRTDFNIDKAMSMMMNGYKVDTVTRGLIGKVNPYFDKSITAVAFEGRIILKSSLHVLLRSVLDNETFADNYSDLYFPHIYTTNRHPQYPFYKVPCDLDTMSVNPYTVALANRVDHFLQQKNIQYHIVMLPVNPDICVFDKSKAATYIAQLKNAMPGIDFINLTGALDNTQFYDAEHPNKKGAKIISLMVADSLKSR